MIQNFMPTTRMQLEANLDLLSHLCGHCVYILILQSKSSKKKRKIDFSYNSGVEVEMETVFSWVTLICTVFSKFLYLFMQKYTSNVLFNSPSFSKRYELILFLTLSLISHFFCFRVVQIWVHLDPATHLILLLAVRF